MKDEYYKAYEERYKKVHESNNLWEIPKPSSEVLNTINKYKISKSSKILELGSGEGRDAIFLLDKGYNVLALEYSISAVNKCKELTNNKYSNNFKQFDLMQDTLPGEYDFIYSVAVIHMFVEEKHRQKFYDFIREHLSNTGKALIIAMGNGKDEYKSDINKAFNEVERTNTNSNEKVIIASTSCRIKSISNMLKEIENSNLKVIENKIIEDVPGFDKCCCFIVEKN